VTLRPRRRRKKRGEKKKGREGTVEKGDWRSLSDREDAENPRGRRKGVISGEGWQGRGAGCKEIGKGWGLLLLLNSREGKSKSDHEEFAPSKGGGHRLCI